MTPLPGALAGKTGVSEQFAWRLDTAEHAPSWQTGEGAFRVGGRWSSPGRRVIYTALDPATAILEVAVHKGFDALDTVKHQLLCIKIGDWTKVHVLDASAIANKNWLSPGAVSPNQQKHGDQLLSAHAFLLVPSVVSRHSWNLLIDVSAADGLFELGSAEDFALDTRLAPRK